MIARASAVLAALFGTAALIIAGGSFRASANDTATIEIVNQSGREVSFVALVADGKGLQDDTPNLLSSVLRAQGGTLTSVAPGAYQLVGTGFASQRVVVNAGDAVTLTLSDQGKGIEVGLQTQAAGAPAYVKKIGQRLEKQ
jgi:hypothetical protein